MSRSFLRKQAFVAVAAVIGLCNAASTAFADLELAVQNAAGNGYVTSDTIQGSPGAVTLDDISGKLGVTVELTSASSNPPLLPLQAGAEAAMDVEQATIVSAGAGTINLVIEATNYYVGPSSVATPAGLLALLSGINISNGATVVGNAYYNDSNQAPGLVGSTTFGAVTITNAGSILGQSFGSGTTTAAFASNFNLPNPTNAYPPASAAITLPASPGYYSLFDVVQIHFTAAGQTVQFDLDSEVVPEPATIAMAAACLPLLAGFTLRRLRKRGN